MRRRSNRRRWTNNGGEVHVTIEDNAIRTATDMGEDNNVGVVEMQDNRDGRQVQR